MNKRRGKRQQQRPAQTGTDECCTTSHRRYQRSAGELSEADRFASSSVSGKTKDQQDSAAGLPTWR